ncbi:LOW QUALITY PROTEIN: hypothetical protein SETIT_4G136100v2 [Setaria italica]|uniref:Uncharacterized protein n=1 Tax=Setaria italica TaxID=4555 RepID=A0A368QU02_SETIT|nr:LOW QUALITY PROTEIN: hypothetical protein SETIT_4G136100v2 [Setaria italica]
MIFIIYVMISCLSNICGWYYTLLYNFLVQDYAGHGTRGASGKKIDLLLRCIPPSWKSLEGLRTPDKLKIKSFKLLSKTWPAKGRVAVVETINSAATPHSLLPILLSLDANFWLRSMDQKFGLFERNDQEKVELMPREHGYLAQVGEGHQVTCRAGPKIWEARDESKTRTF